MIIKTLQDIKRASPEEVVPEEVKIEPSKWKKLVLKGFEWLQETFNWLQGTLFWKGLLKVLKFIQSIWNTVGRLIRSVISWVSRNIFGASHVTTSRTTEIGGFLSGPVRIIIITIVIALPAFILAPATLTFGGMVASLTGSIWSYFGSIPISIGYVFQLIGIIKKSKQTKYDFDKLSQVDSETGKEIITPIKGRESLIFGFLDRLEKTLGIRIKMNQSVRDYIKKFEDILITRVSTGESLSGGKQEKYKERARFYAKEIESQFEHLINPAFKEMRSLLSSVKKISSINKNKLVEFKKIIRENIIQLSRTNQKNKNKFIESMSNEIINFIGEEKFGNIKNESQNTILQIFDIVSTSSEIPDYLLPVPSRIVKSLKKVPYIEISKQIVFCYSLENDRFLKYTGKVINNIKKGRNIDFLAFRSEFYTTWQEITVFEEGIPLINELVWNSFGHSPNKKIDGSVFDSFENWCKQRWYRTLQLNQKDILYKLAPTKKIQNAINLIPIPPREFRLDKFSKMKKIDTEQEYEELQDEWLTEKK